MQKSGLKKKDAERFAITVFEVVKDGLATDRIVKIKGFGTFKVVDMEARESVNVNNGERVLIEGYGKVTFTADTTMKELVNRPFSQFETVVLNEGVTFDDDALDGMDLDADEATDDEDIQTPEPTAAVAEEPVAAEEPAILETEPDVEKETLDFAEEEPEPELEEENPESNEEQPTQSEFYDGEEAESSEPYVLHRSWLWWTGALTACVCSFAIGYFVGIKHAPTEAAADRLEPATLVADTTKTAMVKADSLSKADTTVVKKADSAVLEKADTEVVKKAEVAAVKPKTPAPTALDYEKMDVRVRTGAYRIVGDDYEVKVKAGDNMDRIARRTLGPGMECYIEVYNGIKGSADLKAGQKLKIPKIELKHKKTINK